MNPPGLFAIRRARLSFSRRSSGKGALHCRGHSRTAGVRRLLRDMKGRGRTNFVQMSRLVRLRLSIPQGESPLPRGFDHADDSLATRMHVDVLHRDFLLALAAMAIERFEEGGVRSGLKRPIYFMA